MKKFLAGVVIGCAFTVVQVVFAASITAKSEAFQLVDISHVQSVCLTDWSAAQVQATLDVCVPGLQGVEPDCAQVTQRLPAPKSTALKSDLKNWLSVWATARSLVAKP